MGVIPVPPAIMPMRDARAGEYLCDRRASAGELGLPAQSLNALHLSLGTTDIDEVANAKFAKVLGDVASRVALSRAKHQLLAFL